MSNAQALQTHLPCEDCGSSDALALYDDHTYCYSCETFKWNDDYKQQDKNVYKMETNLQHKPFRGLSEETVKFFGVTVSSDNNTHHYPYYDANNNIVVGHTRYQASRKLGYSTVPITKINNLTQEQINAYRIADNRTNEEAEWDDELLALEIKELEMKDFNLELT